MGKNMNFSQALIALKTGSAIQREGWNGIGLKVKLHRPNPNSEVMTQPYLYIQYPETAKTTPGVCVPWLASQTDILADDWCLA
jgi:hypothetical protein